METISEEEFKEMKEVLVSYGACDRCIGRQFRQLFRGYTNLEIGSAVRVSNNINETSLALERGVRPTIYKCDLCDSLFDNLDGEIERVLEYTQNYDFDTFLIGIRLPREIIEKEKRLWEKIRNDFAESIKKELAREMGEKISEVTGKDVDFKYPDMTIILDFRTSPPKIELDIRPLYIYGEYQKLMRGVPQTRHTCPRCHGKGCPYCNFTGKLYSTSVEEQIGKPILDATGGSNFKLHGAGREDVDVLMLGWRPFVIEIDDPVIRNLDLPTIEKRINSSEIVNVRGLRFSNRQEIVKLKEAKFDKVYEAVIKCQHSADDLRKIEDFFKDRTIQQRTPSRVLHRRADRIRERKVRFIKCKDVDKGMFKAIIKAEHGTYIKELVSGNDGRTDPSISSLVKKPCTVVELNVIKVCSGDNGDC